jgi:hypothetical protein
VHLTCAVARGGREERAARPVEEGARDGQERGVRGAGWARATAPPPLAKVGGAGASGSINREWACATGKREQRAAQARRAQRGRGGNNDAVWGAQRPDRPIDVRWEHY